MTDWITGVFCPLLGVIIANFMFATPTKEVRLAQKRRELGSMNPIPFGVTFASCVGWTIYGCMKRDMYLFWSAMPGAILSLYFCTTSMSLLMLRNQGTDLKVYFQMEMLVLGGALSWCIIALIVALILSPTGIEHEYAYTLVGCVNSALTFLYYASPATSALLVIRTRDSSSLYAPSIVMNIINATMWILYGLLGAKDIFVWGPATAGISFAFFQMTLVLLYPKKAFVEPCHDLEKGVTFTSLSTTMNIITQLSDQQVNDIAVQNEYVVPNEQPYESLNFQPETSEAPPTFNPMTLDVVPQVQEVINPIALDVPPMMQEAFGEALQPMEISTCS